MASLVLTGDTSGQVTIAAPAVAGTNTATLPVATGELSMLGTTGQTWQNVTASRAIGTTYTNSTGKPIFILVTGYVSTGAANINFNINGSSVFNWNTAVGTNARGPIYTIVPVGATYSITGYNVLECWSELR